MKITFRLIFIFFVFFVNAWADDLSTWYTKDRNNKVVVTIQLFLSSTCSHCQKADAFFHKIETTTPNLHVERYFINQDKDALIRFNQLLNEQQMNDFAVPSIFFCNSRWVGFLSAEATGKDLLNAINYCKQQIEDNNKLTEVTVNTLRHLAYANRLIDGLAEQPSKLGYTFVMAFVDSFNPCALFCFAGFLAFLFVEEQRKKQIIASLLYVFALGLIHCFQQVFPSSYFFLLSGSRVPALILGFITIYFVIQYYKKQSMGIFYLLLAFLLGLVITIYQQTCLMSFSGAYEQWLNKQHLFYWQKSLYQFIYQIVYILPLIIIMFAYFFLLRVKRLAILRPKLTRIGLLFLIGIALSLIIYPMVMSNFLISILLILILVLSGFFLRWA